MLKVKLSIVDKLYSVRGNKLEVFYEFNKNWCGVYFRNEDFVLLDKCIDVRGEKSVM